ncbi:MAG TPA: hypothetical protein PL001_02365, partial [Candidatus Kryptobacter bacterium]|nr:hypothetical protein [Candidatus Kryptobacter bacterium]
KVENGISDPKLIGPLLRIVGLLPQNKGQLPPLTGDRLGQENPIWLNQVKTHDPATINRVLWNSDEFSLSFLSQ